MSEVSGSSVGTAGAAARLPAEGANGRARAAALTATGYPEPQPTSLIEYRSHGRVLIVGPADAASDAARTLPEPLRAVLLVTRGEAADDTPAVAVAHGQLHSLRGHLGNFHASLERDGRELALDANGDWAAQSPAPFDLILDLDGGHRAGDARSAADGGVEAHFGAETLPLGYFAPHGEPARERALQEMAALVGTFQKPKFFDYNPDICAHGASGLSGCRRCIQACPTLAIHSIGERIEVDPYLCQGGGSCAAACPSGAITYAYPAVNDLLDHLRAVLSGYREAGGQAPCVLFYGGEDAGAWVEPALAGAPESVLPVAVEEIGSVGIDAWLTALAYGADHVVLSVPPTTPTVVARELAKQAEYARAILTGMGYSGERLAVLEAPDGPALVAGLQALPAVAGNAPAAYATFNEKRNTVRFAVEHLYELSEQRATSAALPPGAPFGEVQVDRNACTLCMACVSVCPESALTDGGELPQLKFVEANCVQCGLCSNACPERAITLASRMLYPHEQWRASRVLNEEEPFACIVCGKPFATRAMMQRMADKLADHWMFQNETARRRLQMCEDCRVADLYANEDDLQVHR